MTDDEADEDGPPPANAPAGLRRWLGVVALAVGATVILVAGFGSWQYWRIASHRRPLAQALWVTERDYSRYYAPGTAEVRKAAADLVRNSPELADARFDAPVLFRRGLANAPATAAILVIPFDPSSVPANRLVLPE